MLIGPNIAADLGAIKRNLANRKVHWGETSGPPQQRQAFCWAKKAVALEEDDALEEQHVGLRKNLNPKGGDQKPENRFPSHHAIWLLPGGLFA